MGVRCGTVLRSIHGSQRTHLLGRPAPWVRAHKFWPRVSRIDEAYGDRNLMSLRLDKLPDRTPVKITIAADPELAAALADYAAIYRQTYGEEEKPEMLILM